MRKPTDTDRELYWAQPQRAVSYYELKSGEDVVATLDRTHAGGETIASATGQMRTFKREGGGPQQRCLTATF